MRNILFTYLLCLFCFSNCFSQITITNKGVTITNKSQNIYLNGSVLNQTTGLIENKGSIYINGNIINNGSTSLADSTTGSIYLNGANQVIGGTHTVNFHKLILNCADTLTLQQSIKVTDSLNFINGFIHLNGNTIDLDSTGILANEKLSGHVFGLAGKIIARKYINQPSLINDIAGLGLRMQSTNNHGQVLIERSHYQQPAADTGIYRFYKVTSQYSNQLDSMIISYFNDEIFRSETNYKVFTKKISGSSGWKNRGGTVDFVNKNVSSKYGNTLDTLLITIADQSCTTPPDIHVTGISNLVPFMKIDTITCAKDTLSINAYSSAPNAFVTWRDPLNNTFGNPLQVSAPNTFFIDVENGVNGCSNSIPVVVTQFTTPPLLNTIADSAFLNCSQSSIQLNGTSLTPQTTLSWTGPGNFNSANPATVITQGKYFITGVRADNGCIKKDSVIVGYKPELMLKSNKDTLVCKNSLVHLSTSETGAVSGVTYLWNNGANSANTNVNPVITTTYIVTASSPGCIGRDTVIVTVSASIIDSVSAFQSCKKINTGTILLYAQGGIPPYLYSIDNGGSYFTSGTFNTIPYGNYSTIIKDSLGCTKSNSVILSGLSKLPIPQFIASTHNTKGDTIVLVDISTPKPDSIHWIFPTHATLIGGDMFDPVIYMPDTGAFVVTMMGYFGDCMIDTTKLIHFSKTDTTIASEYNNNGIKSISLFPNPNNGSFTVGVEFYKKQNASIQIWDTSPAKYFQKNFTDADMISVPVNLPQLLNGTYIVQVIGEYNSKHLNFIISH